ncbi:MAG: DUF3784 domain-containing protein [Bacteroidetes bacterium]|nr:MAG: DUF3784 domain-containing protein [Bacteroidota bacterium]
MFFSFLLTAAILYICGYLVDDRKMEHLIAGFDPEKYEDPRAVGRFFGRHLKWMALPGVGVALADLLDAPSRLKMWLAIGYVILIVVWTMWLSYQDHGFKKKEE